MRHLFVLSPLRFTPQMRARILKFRVSFALLVACALPACGLTAKSIEAGAALVNCIDDHLLAGDPPERIILACGPEAVGLIAGRQALARKRTPCTTVVVDAGQPDGPGR